MFKEQLVEIIQSEGYDFISACEIAIAFIEELKKSKPGINTFSIGTTTIKIKKGIT